MTVGIAGGFAIELEDNRMVPASDLASVDRLVGSALAEVLGRCAASDGRTSMMFSKVPRHVAHSAVAVEDNCRIAPAEEHRYRFEVVHHSCCSSSLLHLDHLALLQVWWDTWVVLHAIYRHSLLDYAGCKCSRGDLPTFGHSIEQQWPA